MSSSSRSYHHGDLKTALVASAERILNEKGIEALSLRTLAADVGVSHMAPYAHFKNKTELFQSIAAKGFNSLSLMLGQVDPEQKPEDLILIYGATYIEFALSNAPLYRLMLAQTQVTGPEKVSQSASHMSDELQQASKKPFALLRDAFSRIESDKKRQSIQAQGAWALVHGISSLLIDGHLHVPKGMSIKDFLSEAALKIER